MKYTRVYTAAVSAAAIAAPSYAHDQVRNLRADDGDLTAASPEPQFFTDWWKYLWKKPEVSLYSVYTLQTQSQSQLVHLSHAHAHDRIIIGQDHCLYRRSSSI